MFFFPWASFIYIIPTFSSFTIVYKDIKATIKQQTFKNGLSSTHSYILFTEATMQEKLSNYTYNSIPQCLLNNTAWAEIAFIEQSSKEWF